VRVEKDALGEREIPRNRLTGIHTLRALENFSISGRSVQPQLLSAMAQVKQACARVNHRLGYLSNEQAQAIEVACVEAQSASCFDDLPLDALQGGAGTSTNLGLSEWICNRALVEMAKKPGDYDSLSPTNHVNLHQSTNDVFPTAMKVAALYSIERLEEAVLSLQEAFQDKEKAFAHVVKVGRTQMNDAVLTTLGREMSAYAEVFSRDRWRLSKARERLRVINLGGTAIGSGLGAPRDFIFQAADELRNLTHLPLSRAENLVDCTQNADVWVECSGLLKTLAVNLKKCANDLRFMASGPDAGIGEITLPAVQAGSSIMPEKVNPVIPEALVQAAIVVEGNDQMIASAVGAGCLELNPFLPLVSDRFLESTDLLRRACTLFADHCVSGMQANEQRCARDLELSSAVATALLPRLGYEAASALAKRAKGAKRSLREQVLFEELLTVQEFESLISPEAVCRLGF
jgi:aspartate ammonia-lyase